MKDRITFDVVVEGVVRTYDLGEAVSVDGDDLNAEFSRQAALLAWWGVLAENAQAVFRKTEIEYDLFVARSNVGVRENLVASGQKVTEALVDRLVDMDPDHVAMKEKLSEVKHRAELLRIAFRAVEEKGRMLQSLGAHRRAEMDMTGHSV